MKLKKTIAAFIVGSLLTAGLAFAGEAKKDAAPKAANCCVKAAKDKAACKMECCAAAAKAGNNCEKCGGIGKAEAKKPAAKS